MTHSAEKDATSCGHLGRDFNGNCFTCAREAERRADMAKAYDRGVRDMARALQGGNEPVNPYRVLPPGSGDKS